MVHEIQRSPTLPADEAEFGRLVGDLDIFQTLVTVLRDLGASDPSMSMDNEVQRLIGVIPDRIHAFLDLSPPGSTGAGHR
ncbi:uncharacterized protein EI90DRAFT_3075630 [Cantharellus anzutake]|uniref:uncharacterized protein n=1 Tax=Cantharellus anzutake TaxID=1750568 RepID=UPI0019078BCD|nr:uncharacterized protein EI90DRAFT_3075630 [Cantharellus anzutake]KAF8324271.1 hypothetical protein EI90DRAFT_3075630 [Cantharellus anzutake]